MCQGTLRSVTQRMQRLIGDLLEYTRAVKSVNEGLAQPGFRPGVRCVDWGY